MDADYSAAYPELYKHHWWWRAREAVLVRKIRQLRAHRTGPARILDVGCGAGLFFDTLIQFGDVEGIESDRAAVSRSGQWRDRITVGELDDSYRPCASFDIILLLDTLEHVDGPTTLLRRAAAILQPEGHLVITVPAFNWLWTAHDEMNHHVRRYTADAMEEQARDAGLRITELSYMFQSLVLPKLLVRVKEAMVGRRKQIPRIPIPFVNRGLQTWYRAEHSLLGSLPIGSSLLVIAERVH